MPKISVIMPVYNGEAYIDSAIESVLRQSLRDFELIIVNDGSSDRTLDLINAYEDNRIKLVSRAENRGLAFTRNEGVAAASGKYIAMLDSDDTSAVERLEIQSDYLDKNIEIGAVGSWVNILDERGFLTGETWRLETCPEKVPVALMFHNCFAQSAIMARRELIGEDPYRLDLPVAEDYDLWVRLAKVTQLSNLPKPLINYRCHQKGVSRRRAAASESCTINIIVAQLEALGVYPTPEEMQVHRHLGKALGADADVTFSAAEDWLAGLLMANEKSRTYDNVAFRKVMHERWFEFCQMSSCQGWKALRAYRKSFLRKIDALPFTHLCGFGLRCLLKQ